jgi:hypothetical protein
MARRISIAAWDGLGAKGTPGLYPTLVCVSRRREICGEHAAILKPGTWERVQKLITHPAAFARGKSRNKHLALLGGLLYCESCSARMVYTYSGKGDRKYPYYVCLNAQRKGWAVCPGKSLSARTIEESVLGQIRETQSAMIDPAEWEQLDRTRQVEAVQAVVERVGYDGIGRQISIRFHPPVTVSPGEEARA